MIITRWNFVY